MQCCIHPHVVKRAIHTCRSHTDGIKRHSHQHCTLCFKLVQLVAPFRMDTLWLARMDTHQHSMSYPAFCLNPRPTGNTSDIHPELSTGMAGSSNAVQHIWSKCAAHTVRPALHGNCLDLFWIAHNSANSSVMRQSSVVSLCVAIWCVLAAHWLPCFTRPSPARRTLQLYTINEWCPKLYTTQDHGPATRITNSLQSCSELTAQLSSCLRGPRTL